MTLMGPCCMHNIVKTRFVNNSCLQTIIGDWRQNSLVHSTDVSRIVKRLGQKFDRQHWKGLQGQSEVHPLNQKSVWHRVNHNLEANSPTAGSQIRRPYRESKDSCSFCCCLCGRQSNWCFNLFFCYHLDCIIYVDYNLNMDCLLSSTIQKSCSRA